MKNAEFMAKFNFRPEGALLVGVERECFLLNKSGQIAPLAVQVFENLPDQTRFGYELSACQLEDRIGPCVINNLRSGINENEIEIKKAEAITGFTRLFCEVAPENMPLDIYPDPTGRYQRISKTLPKRVLVAACRVTGVHVHIGMPDHETALRVYNKVISHYDALCQMGDGSGGARLELYHLMAPNHVPCFYESWDEFCAEAQKDGFVEDPRKCWRLIRISVHGTIEFRMFGSTSDIDKIVTWAEYCHRICQEAM